MAVVLRSAQGTVATHNGQPLMAPPIVALAYKVATKQPTGAYSMQGWARLMGNLASNAPSSAATKWGSPLRQALARGTGNGARANGKATYGTLTGAQLASICVAACTPGTPAKVHVAVGKVLHPTKGRKAQGSSARRAKATAPATAPAPVAVQAPTAPAPTAAQ
jgi:hypothetical protein